MKPYAQFYAADTVSRIEDAARALIAAGTPSPTNVQAREYLKGGPCRPSPRSCAPSAPGCANRQPSSPRRCRPNCRRC